VPPSPADRYVIAVPLAIWAISLALPTAVANQNDWFFPGQSSGIAAGFMSFLSLVLFLATQKELSHNPSTLAYGYFGSLWFANILMVAAPFMSAAIRRRRGLGFVILMWVWFLLALPLPLLARKQPDVKLLEVGYLVWMLSLFTMALLLTGYHVQAPRAPLHSVRPSR
jgi:hypothetical protein